MLATKGTLGELIAGKEGRAHLDHTIRYKQRAKGCIIYNVLYKCLTIVIGRVLYPSLREHSPQNYGAPLTFKLW